MEHSRHRGARCGERSRRSWALAGAVVCAVALLGSAALGQSAGEKNREVVRVGIESDYPPYSYLGGDGSPIGFNVDVLRAVSEATGLFIDIDYRAWAEIREDLERGTLDAICGMYASSERDRTVDFSPPLTIVHHAAFRREGAPGIERPDELRGKRLIVMRGDIMHDHVLAQGYCESPVLADTQADALRLLADGRGEFALLAKLPGLHWARELELELDVSTVGPTLRPSRYCFAVREGDRELLGRLREGLALLIQTGRLAEIADRWLGTLDRETTAAGVGPPVRVGVLAEDGAARCRATWGLTIDYLDLAVSGHAFDLVPLDFDSVGSAAEDGEVDFVLANPSMYVSWEVKHGAQRIATLKRRRGSHVLTTSGGVIFTRSDDPRIRTLSDLHGASLMAVDERSFGGWQAAARALVDHGIDPRDDLTGVRFAGTHDAVVLAVRDGAVDAGTVRTGTLERMAGEGAIRLEGLLVLAHDHGEAESCRSYPHRHSTDLYPEWPMAQLAHVPDELAEAVAAALIGMPEDSPAARAAECAGWTVPHNYQSVHDCSRTLRVSPYVYLG